MAETKKEASGQEPSTAAASQQTDTKPVVDLLTSILNEVQKQVRSKTPKPLEGLALEAGDLFRDIVAALALAPKPNITVFEANPNKIENADNPITTLRWSSTGARRLSLTARAPKATIDKDLGELTPTATGTRPVDYRDVDPTLPGGEIVFTATASGFCGVSDTKRITVISTID